MKVLLDIDTCLDPRLYKDDRIYGHAGALFKKCCEKYKKKKKKYCKKCPLKSAKPKNAKCWE